MKKKPEVYLFGQILGTHSFLLKGGFLQPDEYSEISEKYFLPGGETGTSTGRRRWICLRCILIRRIPGSWIMW